MTKILKVQRKTFEATHRLFFEIFAKFFFASNFFYFILFIKLFSMLDRKTQTFIGINNISIDTKRKLEEMTKIDGFEFIFKLFILFFISKEQLFLNNLIRTHKLVIEDIKEFKYSDLVVFEGKIPSNYKTCFCITHSN